MDKIGLMTAQEINQTLISILNRHDARHISIFGSCARGDFHPDSDLNVLVDFAVNKSLLTQIGIEQELSDALGIKVDLLTKKAISPHLIERIRKDQRVIQ